MIHHLSTYRFHCKTVYKKVKSALACMAQWIECSPANQRVTCSFPVGEQAWVTGWVPSGGHARGKHTLMFLSFSFSLHFSKINKIFNKKMFSEARMSYYTNSCVYASQCSKMCMYHYLSSLSASPLHRMVPLAPWCTEYDNLCCRRSKGFLSI